ncbi:hypothetical protein [Bacillus rubiinfantis]|uniref:hypothetical protein n=1 Tax=Bacillus rubiinfantis TaxID=1499680 RepID=UPI0005A92A01|nr:hypothetical protein [Bacillus rubiinfantis]
MSTCSRGINIGTISGGIVNFGGAGTIAPISITNTTSDSNSSSKGLSLLTSSTEIMTNTAG